MINGWDQFKSLQPSPALDSEAPRRHLFNKELALEIEFSINRQKQEIGTAVDMTTDDFITDRIVDRRDPKCSTLYRASQLLERSSLRSFQISNLTK